MVEHNGKQVKMWAQEASLEGEAWDRGLKGLSPQREDKRNQE